VTSFIFFTEINATFNKITPLYIDSGQYIVFYIGLLISFYGIKELSINLLSILISFRLFDEMSLDDSVVNYIDYLEILLIFVLGFYNYKNFKA